MTASRADAVAWTRQQGTDYLFDALDKALTRAAAEPAETRGAFAEAAQVIEEVLLARTAPSRRRRRRRGRPRR